MNPTASAGAVQSNAWIGRLLWFGLISIAALCWVLLVQSERSMGGAGLLAGLMRNMMHPGDPLPYLASSAWMWIVMMVAMMMPAAFPITRAAERARREGGDAHPTLVAFGYLAAWSGFALVASMLQWALHRQGWLSKPALALAPALAGGVLVAAGVYQLTPLKEACLRHCRSPLGFVLEHWRPGRRGAVRMGLRHGLYCVGCCWVLMLLMFAGGAMSVLCMAAISLFILGERVLPEGPWVSRAPGLLLLGVGLFVWINAPS